MCIVYLLQIHQSIEQDISKGMPSANIETLDHSEMGDNDPMSVSKPVMVSTEVQTDDATTLPCHAPCYAPCCNKDPPKCTAPCCNGDPPSAQPHAVMESSHLVKCRYYPRVSLRSAAVNFGVFKKKKKLCHPKNFRLFLPPLKNVIFMYRRSLYIFSFVFEKNPRAKLLRKALSVLEKSVWRIR